MQVNLLRSGGVGLLAAATLLAAAIPAGADTAKPGHGTAYGTEATVSLVPGALGAKGLTVTTGKMAPSNADGTNSATTVDAALHGLVSAKVITSSAKHVPATTGIHSDAALVRAALPVLAAAAGTTPTATVISSQCHATSSGITAGANLVDLDLGKIGHLSAASPNETVEVPGVVKVVGNEQIRHSDGSLTVNALHITLLGGQATRALGSGDIVLASSTCAKPASAVGGKTPTPTPPPANHGPASGGPAGGEVSVIPSGAPQTGDGSLATVTVG